SRSSWSVPPYTAIRVRRVLLTCAGGASPDNDRISTSDDPGPGAYLPALVVPQITKIFESAMSIGPGARVGSVSGAVALPGCYIARMTRSPVRSDIPRSREERRRNQHYQKQP